ncbi:MAG: SIMPL domain-containing protein [Gemmatimonadota bacterium]|jgi:hypothetical protein|nr:MAG: SIMPL domain-containing protein [Gemmatimonadota bacterium]
MNGNRGILGASLIAIGIAAAGWQVGHGFSQGRAVDRFVTVKGVSERGVEADLALWPLQFVSADNDLSRAQRRLDESIRVTLAFLAEQGLDTTETRLQGLRVTDVLANPYQQQRTVNRFVVQQTLVLRSTEPRRALAASERIGKLVDAGVVLSSGSEYGIGGPTFLFTGLNDIKPEMIAEATARGREAAEQFAADSRSRIAGIRRANQGVFVILPRDQAPGLTEQGQLEKTVRVVSTIEYFLED